MLRHLAPLALGALALLSAACAPQNRPLAAGDVAPEFSLVGSDGKTHRLSDHRGKFVVVAWFPKAFTGG
jgi:peroxiredoxin Q/BCP